MTLKSRVYTDNIVYRHSTRREAKPVSVAACFAQIPPTAIEILYFLERKGQKIIRELQSVELVVHGNVARHSWKLHTERSSQNAEKPCFPFLFFWVLKRKICFPLWSAIPAGKAALTGSESRGARLREGLPSLLQVLQRLRL